MRKVVALSLVQKKLVEGVVMVFSMGLVLRQISANGLADNAIGK
jgi:hypothetical protein